MLEIKPVAKTFLVSEIDNILFQVDEKTSTKKVSSQL
jgi:hypothetical protein